jgi:ABC-type lipoprotein release transport system permease subunit
MISKIVTILLGAALGAALIAIVAGLTISLLVIGVLALTMLVRRDWVPVVYNVRSLMVRGWTTGVTAMGLALVVFVFATALMLSRGIQKTLASTGTTENAHIIRKGAQTEIQSGVQPEHLRLLSAAPETAMGKDGKPLAAGELAVLIFAHKADATSSSDGANVLVRGVSEKSIELHPPARVEGRMFKPGTSEIVIGKGLLGRFKGTRLNESMQFARRKWLVVGVMDQGGSGFDSEIWGDLEQFEDAFQRHPSFSAITLRLRDKDAISALEARLQSDPMLNTLVVKREVDYWAAQSEQFATFVKFLGIFVAVIFSFAAILGAMITMYAQVTARTQEIGTLRVLGFRRRSVLVSFVIESVLLALASGGIGLACASGMQLVSFSTMNFQSLSEVSFQFTLTPAILVASMMFAGLMGYAGGLLPALRASRMPITQATRGG